jgi:hypothetical protein
MDILLLFLLLQVKHFYADFVIQTYMQTVKKGVYFDPVGMSHSLDHCWSTLLALLIFNSFFPIDPILILLVSLVESTIHYHIDWTKVKFGSKDMTKPAFWSEFGLDQLAHQLTYIAMVYVLILL